MKTNQKRLLIGYLAIIIVFGLIAAWLIFYSGFNANAMFIIGTFIGYVLSVVIDSVTVSYFNKER